MITHVHSKLRIKGDPQNTFARKYPVCFSEDYCLVAGRGVSIITSRKAKVKTPIDFLSLKHM